MKKPVITKVLQVVAIIIIVGGIIGSLLMSQTPEVINEMGELVPGSLDGSIFLIGSLGSIAVGSLLMGIREIIVQLCEIKK